MPTVSGTFRRTNGQPIAGAAVGVARLGEDRTAWVRTTADGAYRFVVERDRWYSFRTRVRGVLRSISFYVGARDARVDLVVASGERLAAVDPTGRGGGAYVGGAATCPHCRRPIPVYDPGYACEQCGLGGPMPTEAYERRAEVIDLDWPGPGAQCRHNHAFGIVRVPRRGGVVWFLTDDQRQADAILRGLAAGRTGPNRLVLLFRGPRARRYEAAYSVRAREGQPAAVRVYSDAALEWLRRP